jgi:hypothetical protein
VSHTTYDVTALADQLMHDLRTTFAHFEPADRPFDAAWKALMDRLGIPRADHHLLKSEVGRALSKRPKKERSKKSEMVKAPRVLLEVAEVNPDQSTMRVRIRAGTSMLTFRQVGTQMVHTATEGHAGEALTASAKRMAQEQFDAYRQMARTRTNRDKDHFVLLSQNRDSVCIVHVQNEKTETRVVATLGISGRIRLTHDSPTPLDRVIDTTLRRIAKTHFAGVDSMPFPGM